MSKLPERVKPVSHPQPLRVLFVEDNPRDVTLTARVLEKSGYRLEFATADTPALLLDHLKKADPQIIISDYNLSGWTAIDVLETVRELEKDIPVVILSGSLGDEAAVECIKKGAMDYVLKDRMARLPSAIERALADKALRDDRNRAEENLRKSEASLATAQRIAHLGSWDEDLIENTLQWSEETYRIFGITRDSFGGTRQDFLNCVHPLDRELLKKTAEEAKLGRKPFSLDHRIILPDGKERVVYEEAEVIFDKNQRAVRMVGTVQDITGRRLLENQLRQASKMEAVGRLAGGVAHDFNNLLTIITGYSQLLLGRLNAEDPMQAPLKEIENAADRAAGLTHQLLAFSRKQVLAPLVLDLNVVVANMDVMLQRLIGEDIDLVTSCGTALGRVKADPGQIEQVIMNLAVNARDAMLEGGKLTIETANVDLGENYAHGHVAITPGPYVMLAVTDTGSGMNQETQGRIFEPFFTTKEQGKGTGLGLATVYGIVKQSDGFIWVYSEPEQGTTFKIYLPRVEKAPATTGLPNARPAPQGGSETILLVEDEESLRRLVRAVLESNGYTVLEASRGEEALRICAHQNGIIDLVLTDVVMPQMNGRELAKQLISLHPDTKVLYMSGYTDNAIVSHGVLDEGTPFIQKPFTPDALARKVREVLAA